MIRYIVQIPYSYIRTAMKLQTFHTIFFEFVTTSEAFLLKLFDCNQ